jgi:solute carrier family 25 phosphate transporter 23/24/25/41
MTGKQTPGFDSLTSTLVTVIRQEGWRGLFKGNGTNIIRIVPYSAIQFAAYETLINVTENSFYLAKK